MKRDRGRVGVFLPREKIDSELNWCGFYGFSSGQRKISAVWTWEIADEYSRCPRPSFLGPRCKVPSVGRSWRKDLGEKYWGTITNWQCVKGAANLKISAKYPGL